MFAFSKNKKDLLFVSPTFFVCLFCFTLSEMGVPLELEKLYLEKSLKDFFILDASTKIVGMIMLVTQYQNGLLDYIGLFC